MSVKLCWRLGREGKSRTSSAAQLVAKPMPIEGGCPWDCEGNLTDHGKIAARRAIGTEKTKRALEFPPDFAMRAFMDSFPRRLDSLTSPPDVEQTIAVPATENWSLLAYGYEIRKVKKHERFGAVRISEDMRSRGGGGNRQREADYAMT